METPYVPTDERTTRKFPLLLTTGRILSQYNVGAQTRRTENTVWHPEDILEIHESDAALRGIADGSQVNIASRVGQTLLRAKISDRVPAGVVYTTFHHPISGANVITTDFSDWATNCPEYKVTAVEVRPASENSQIEAEEVSPALVRMAKQIAESIPTAGDASRAIASHLQKFWTVQMRAELSTYVASHQAEFSPELIASMERVQ
jgi:formate dehydrogenase major subunit